MSGDDTRTSRIRERAYHLWERGHHGREADHWLQAEREIDAEMTAVAAPPAAPTTKKSARAKAKPDKPKAAAAKAAKRKPKAKETRQH